MAAVESSANRHDIDEKKGIRKRKKSEKKRNKKAKKKSQKKYQKKYQKKAKKKRKKAKIARKCHQIQHYFFLFPVKVIMCHSSQA